MGEFVVVISTVCNVYQVLPSKSSQVPRIVLGEYVYCVCSKLQLYEKIIQQNLFIRKESVL